jgi:hypothetical protein
LLLFVRCRRRRAAALEDDVEPGLLKRGSAQFEKKRRHFRPISTRDLEPGDDAEWNRSPYPSPSTCHFVREAVPTGNGHVTYEMVQV